MTDKDRLDWLAENFFHSEMDALDRKLHPNQTAWRFFGLRNDQGDIRKIIDNVMKHEGYQDGYLQTAEPDTKVENINLKSEIESLKFIISKQRSALEVAESGLKWYIDTYRDDAHECDEVALGMIERALSLSKDYNNDYADIEKDAERYRYLKNNNAQIIAIENERRGYRSTDSTARPERWFEFEGWGITTVSSKVSFPTMDEVIDYAMENF